MRALDTRAKKINRFLCRTKCDFWFRVLRIKPSFDGVFFCIREIVNKYHFPTGSIAIDKNPDVFIVGGKLDAGAGGSTGQSGHLDPSDGLADTTLNGT